MHSSLAARCTKAPYALQEKQRQRANDVRLKHETGVMADVPAAALAAAPPVCKIVYASRTHSQLQQVARELDKTAYSRAKCAPAWL